MPQRTPSQEDTAAPSGPYPGSLVAVPSHGCIDSEGPRCCCGQESCPCVLESKRSIAELERDVHVAASLGKALLDKHERAMSEVNSEKAALAKMVESLEEQTRQLELANERQSEENRSLLDELEDLNSAMSASESRVKELQDELDAAHAELARINGAAARAEVLESQLSILEQEQHDLRNTLNTTREEERAANVRWRKAERALADVTEQLERMMREHRMEKARTQNLIERLEKRRLLERSNMSFPSVLADRKAMSQYMKEVLAENSSLQNGLVEMQQMLLASQEEVANLREELANIREDNSRSPLSQELGIASRQLPQEVHFHHHHYHSKTPGRPSLRVKKKRLSTIEGKFGSLSKIVEPASASPPESPLTRINRWSTVSGQSSATLSSMPTSPISHYTSNRSSITFERLSAIDTTRPSSVDSEFDFQIRNEDAKNKDIGLLKGPGAIVEISEEPTAVSPRPVSRLYRSTSHESILSTVDAQASLVESMLSNNPYRSPFPVTSPNSQVAPQQIAASGRAATTISRKSSGSLAYNQLLLSSGAVQRSDVPPTSFRNLPKWLWKWAPNPLTNLSSPKDMEENDPSASNNEQRGKPSPSLSTTPTQADIPTPTSANKIPKAMALFAGSGAARLNKNTD